MAELDYGPTPSRTLDLTTKGYVDAKTGTGGGSGSATVGVPTFVQQSAPTYSSGPYVWYQIDATGQVVNVYVEGSGGYASETFTVANQSGWPSQWTALQPTLTVNNQAGRATPNSGGYAAATGYLSGMSAVGDCELQFTITGQAVAVDQFAIATVNSDGVGSGIAWAGSTGYGVAVNYTADPTQSSLTLNIVGTNSWQQVAQSAVMTLNGTTAYRVRFQRSGLNLRAKVWQLNTAEPAWQVTYTITGTPPTGRVTLAAVNGSNGTARSFDYDDVLVTSPGA